MAGDLQEQRAIMKRLTAERDREHSQLRDRAERIANDARRTQRKVEMALNAEIAKRTGIDLVRLGGDVVGSFEPDLAKLKRQQERLREQARRYVAKRRRASDRKLARDTQSGLRDLLHKAYHNPSWHFNFATSWDEWHNESEDNGGSASAGGAFETLEIPDFGFGSEATCVIHPYATASAGRRHHGYANGSVTQRLTFEREAPQWGEGETIQWGVQEVTIALDAWGLGEANASDAYLIMSSLENAGGWAQLLMSIRVDQLVGAPDGGWELESNEIVRDAALVMFVSRGGYLASFLLIPIPLYDPPVWGGVSIDHSPACVYRRPFVLTGHSAGGGLVAVHVDLTCTARAEYSDAHAELTFNGSDQQIQVHKLILSGDSYTSA